MRKGYKVRNMRLMESYSGWKCHLADADGRLYLCDCGMDLNLRFKLGITTIRGRGKTFKRNAERCL